MRSKAQDLADRARQHLQLSATAEAEACLRKAVRLAPRDPSVLTTLGVLLFQLGRPGEARPFLAKAAAFDARNPDRHANLGAACAADGDQAAAIAACERAVALAPDHMSALLSLARVHGSAPRSDQALALYLGLLPRLTANTPVCDEAIAFILTYSSLAATTGALNSADATVRKLLALCPDLPAAWNRLGINRSYRGTFRAALSWLDRSVTLSPAHPQYRLDRAGASGLSGDATSALTDLAVARALDPGNWVAYTNRATILDKMGRIDEALADARRAVAVSPATVTTWMTLIPLGMRSSRAHPDLDAQTFGGIHGHLPAVARPHNQRRSALRKLRVGYYSADFRRHSCAWFIEPLLEWHDRNRFEINAYAEVIAPDDVTARLCGLVDTWHPTVGQDDETLAQRIAADGIDILVDLTGLFAGGRPLLFARRPAPVQVSWLGYNASTGITAIDWKLVDDWLAPPGVGLDWFAEGLWRLPRLSHCWRPPADAPLPARDDERPTFGSFNSLAKLSQETIDLWAMVLRQTSEARLVLKADQSSDAQVQHRLRAQFADCGVTPDRIEFLDYTTSTADHLALYAKLDVALDPLPYNGTTTTCEALWMGVPVVSLAGNRLAGRIGASLLAAAGREGLVANDPQSYLAIASGLISDRHRLKQERAELRQVLIRSPLRDEIGFARAIEAAYMEMVEQAVATF